MISVAVMAHPLRAAAAEALAVEAGATIIWDEIGDEWHTGARAIAAYDRQATHHIVLQDDAVLVPDFLDHAGAAIAEHPTALISFYLGTGDPVTWQGKFDRATLAADDQGSAWLSARRLLHGVALAIPVADIENLLDWCNSSAQPYDDRIGTYWWSVTDRLILYTWPSLVDHEDNGTLAHLASTRPRARKARRLGIPVSWATPVLPI